MRSRVVLLASTLSLLAFCAFPSGVAPENPCKPVPSGFRACGQAQVIACGTGSATGEATGPVDWHLHIDTNHGDADAYDNDTSVTALAASAPCWTDTCTTASLYADGVLVSSTLTYC